MADIALLVEQFNAMDDIVALDKLEEIRELGRELERRLPLRLKAEYRLMAFRAMESNQAKRIPEAFKRILFAEYVAYKEIEERCKQLYG